MATGFPVKANYATGDVLTATNMNDLSGTVNYLQYMTPRNPVLNSAFNVWQRGTSISLAASTVYTSGFTADRWQTATAANQATTISRQATGDTTNLPNIQYCLRFQRNSGQTGTSNYDLLQNVETLNATTFAGKQVTFSFYARAGANYSASGNLLYFKVVTGTGTDQNYFSTYTGAANTIAGTATLTTTWQRFTATATMPSNMTEFSIDFTFAPTGTAGAADYFEITGVQLELGSVANTYMPNQPTYQGELAACQRYYFRNTANSAYNIFCAGMNYSTTQAILLIQFPQAMRIAPSVLEYSNLGLDNSSATPIALSSLVFAHNGNQTGMLTGTVASGLVAGNATMLSAQNSTSGYVAISAEL